MLRILGNAGLSAALEERSDFSIRRVLDGNEVFSQFFDAIEGLRVFLVLHLATGFGIAKFVRRFSRFVETARTESSKSCVYGRSQCNSSPLVKKHSDNLSYKKCVTLTHL